MTTKKISPKASSAYEALPQIQKIGLRSSLRLTTTERDSFRVTASGREVALTFGGGRGARATNIYVDEIMTVIQRKESRVYFTGRTTATKFAPTRKRVGEAGRLVAKKSSGRGSGASGSAFKEVVRVEGQQLGETFTVYREPLPFGEQALKSSKPIIPASIKRFVLHFFNNLRKLICPKAGAKPTLSVGTNAAVGAIGGWIASELGAPPALAASLGSAVMILIVTATKGAFCDMAAEVAKQAIRKA